MSFFNLKGDFFSNIVANNIEDTVKDSGTFVTSDIQKLIREKTKIPVDNKHVENIIGNANRMLYQMYAGVITAVFTQMATWVVASLTSLFVALKVKEKAVGVFSKISRAFKKGTYVVPVVRSVDFSQSEFEEAMDFQRKTVSLDFGATRNFSDSVTYAIPAIATMAVAKVAVGLMTPDYEAERSAHLQFNTLVNTGAVVLSTVNNVKDGITTTMHQGVVEQNANKTRVKDISMAKLLEAIHELRNTRTVGV